MAGVWVLIEQREGAASNVSWEALGVARQVADGRGEPLTAVVFGTGAAGLAEEAIKRGADNAIASEDETLASLRMDAYASLLSSLAGDRDPSVIIAGQSSAGLEIMAAAGVDLEAGLVSDVVSIEMDGGVVKASVPVYSGKLIATVFVPEGLQLLTVRSRAFPVAAVVDSRSGEIEMVGAVKAEDELTSKVTEFEAKEGSVSLTDAGIVVSGGRGVGSPEGFEPIVALANALGGAVGASRAVVDAGWISYDHQVGQTGKVVSPDLYIAAGISGAVQHQAGMRTSKVIVAINKDAEAPIFKLAKYGVVADLFDIVPALTEEARNRLS